MKRAAIYALFLIGGVVALAAPLRFGLFDNEARHPGWNPEKTQYTLFNGWKLSPVGRGISLPGDMPGNIVVLEGGRQALVNTCGFHDHSLNLVDLEKGTINQSVPFERSWIGLAKTPDGKVLVSGGKADNAAREAIHQLTLTENGFTPAGELNVPGTLLKDRFVSSILSTPEGNYILNIQTDYVVKLAPKGSILARRKVGYRPYACALSPDGKILAVSNWGDQSVSLLNASDLFPVGTVSVGSHPTSLAYSPNGRLFVANAGSNDVSIIDGGKVTESIPTGVDPSQKIGATPVALAVARDSKRLYVANAGNNCLAVIDISKAGHTRRLGLIPTERYPTAVAVTPDGKQILIGTAKGYFGPNAGEQVKLEGDGIRGKEFNTPFKYVGNQMTGRLTIVETPDAKQLKAYTKQTIANSPAGLAAAHNAEERKKIQSGAFDKIKHVVYVIRENRTYDQVLGDIPKGNGDPHLTIFGEKVTPNGHKLANDFVLFDNLYADGDVSQAGHQWSDAAYSNDYTEKQWILNYSNKGEVESDTRLTSSPGEYIWTLARKKGHTARVYGEYVSMQEDHDSANSEELKADPEKFGFSASFEKIFARGGRDTEKVADFLREMHEAEKTGKWPELMVMALPEDHTNGFSAGAHSPYAMIANNDWAVGQLVDAVSHSPFWKDTAIFIIQDDAQAGPDHVDSHRTVALVASPYANRGSVDHTMYSTSSMLRTMELILHLPPMTEFDAKSTPMYAAFTNRPDFSPFVLEKPQVDVDERNPKGTSLALRSSKLDFSDVDRADFNELNRILWAGYRPHDPYPGIRSRK